MATDLGGATHDILDPDWFPLLEDVVDGLVRFGMTLAGVPVDGLVEAWLVPADGSEPARIDAALVTLDPLTSRVEVDLVPADGDVIELLYQL